MILITSIYVTQKERIYVIHKRRDSHEKARVRDDRRSCIFVLFLGSNGRVFGAEYMRFQRICIV